MFEKKQDGYQNGCWAYWKFVKKKNTSNCLNNDDRVSILVSKNLRALPPKKRQAMSVFGSIKWKFLKRSGYFPWVLDASYQLKVTNTHTTVHACLRQNNLKILQGIKMTRNFTQCTKWPTKWYQKCKFWQNLMLKNVWKSPENTPTWPWKVQIDPCNKNLGKYFKKCLKYWISTKAWKS